jgi:hypothetical protein
LTNNVSVYAVDGWSVLFANGTAVMTVQQVADAPAGFTNSVKFSVTTGGTVAAGSLMLYTQKLEGEAITNVGFGAAGAQPLALSFWVKSSIGTYTASGSLRNAAGTRSYPFNFTITNSATWERKTIIIPGDVTGTWVTSGTAAGLLLDISAAVGSTFQGTANTWAASNLLGTSSNTNTILSTNGATFAITGVKLEIGPAVTRFTRRRYSEELALCQRYYEKSYDIGTALGAVTANGEARLTATAGGNIGGMSVPFKVTKRAAPTITLYSPSTGATGKTRDDINGVDVNGSTASIGMGAFMFFATLSAGTNIGLRQHWVADARL